jgi:hypothetical protein
MGLIKLLGAWLMRRWLALVSSTKQPLVENRVKGGYVQHKSPSKSAVVTRDPAHEEARQKLAERQRDHATRKPAESTRASMHGPLFEPLREKPPIARKSNGPVVLAIEPIDPDRPVIEQEETEPMPFYTSPLERDEKVKRR